LAPSLIDRAVSGLYIEDDLVMVATSITEANGTIGKPVA